jgi:hypothetical protein
MRESTPLAALRMLQSHGTCHAALLIFEQHLQAVLCGSHHSPGPMGACRLLPGNGAPGMLMAWLACFGNLRCAEGKGCLPVETLPYLAPRTNEPQANIPQGRYLIEKVLKLAIQTAHD